MELQKLPNDSLLENPLKKFSILFLLGIKIIKKKKKHLRNIEFHVNSTQLNK